MVGINGLFHLCINGVFIWGYNPLILTFYYLPGTSEQEKGDMTRILPGSLTAKPPPENVPSAPKGKERIVFQSSFFQGRALKLRVCMTSTLGGGFKYFLVLPLLAELI